MDDQGTEADSLWTPQTYFWADFTKSKEYHFVQVGIQLPDQLMADTVPSLAWLPYRRGSVYRSLLFFGQYVTGTIYTSFFFSSLSAVFISFLLNEFFRTKTCKRILVLVFLFPFSYRMFLPCSLSMGVFLTVLIAYISVRNLVVFPARLTIRLLNNDWVYQTSVFLLAAINMCMLYGEVIHN